MADEIYGVQPQGFSRKPFNVTLVEIETAMRAEFGGNVVQSPQSPFGQLNGLMSTLVTMLWEMAEEVYQSYDVDQAESTRLDTLAKIRLLERQTDETDAHFRLAINNQDRARIDIQDIARAVAGIDGVTFCYVWVNDSAEADPDTGLPGGTLCVAIVGGDDAEIAAILRLYVVPGISVYGNTYVTTEAEGYCRTMILLRPVLVPFALIVRIIVRKDVKGCPPPALISIVQAIAAALAPGGSHALRNGDDVSYFLIRSIVEALWPNVEVLSIVATAKSEDPWHPTGTDGALAIAFEEMATLAAADVTIEVSADPVALPLARAGPRR